MPAKSPEALERKRARRMVRDRAKAKAKRGAAPVVDSPHRKFYAGPAHGLSKSGLRAMLADAVKNTGAADAD